MVLSPNKGCIMNDACNDANPARPASDAPAPPREANRIEGGIEWFAIPHRVEDGVSFDAEEDCQCARCGSSAEFLRCANCGGEGYSHHDCGEDCCCCLEPEANVVCNWCNGTGGEQHCVSSPEWCAANPLPGRAHIESTALRAEAWDD